MQACPAFGEGAADATRSRDLGLARFALLPSLQRNRLVTRLVLPNRQQMIPTRTRKRLNATDLLADHEDIQKVRGDDRYR
jgi:hypothetical protein